MSIPSRPVLWSAFVLILGAALFVIFSTDTFRKEATTSPPIKRNTPSADVVKTPAKVEIAHDLAKPCDRTVLTHLDLSRPPTEAELIAAGNLGEPLTPTHSADVSLLTDPEARKRQKEDNLSFGIAIQAWNEHRYEDAIGLFETHLKNFPNSPWTAECQLHLGCYCQYNARFSESADHFEEILASVPRHHEMWHKAKLRRSILHLDQGNLRESERGFAEMRQSDPDHRHQTYASYWIRELALYKRHETALRDCGQKALAHIAETLGLPEEAKALKQLTAAGPHGFTATELHGTALTHGLDSRPVTAATELDALPTPFVAHYTDRHYVTVEEVSEYEVRLYDNRVGTVTTMPRFSFEREWSGFALIFSDPPALAGILPATDLDAVVGGCCGLPRHPSDLGDDDCEKDCGLPGWSVNMLNMNFRVRDTPMWWDAPYGPPVYMTLLFNSLDSLNNYTPFGEKWSFAYDSWLLITPGSQVQVKDGDGRLETYAAPGGGGSYPITYTPPAGEFRELVETANHVFELRHQDGTIYHYGIPAAMQGSSSVPLLLSIADRHGNTLTITHNANGAVTNIGHSALPPTDTWDFYYVQITLPDTTVVSRVDRIEDPFGRTCTFGYDANANLTNQTDMGGVAYSYGYTIKPAEGTEPDSMGNYPVSDELFIDAITTPKGTTTINTEPADGIATAPGGGAVGYYPPYGDPMWSNYRIRVYDPENNMQEFYFNGYDANPGQQTYGDDGFVRDGEQAARATVPDPTKPWLWTGPKTVVLYDLVGGKGTIKHIYRADAAGTPVLSNENLSYDSNLRLPTDRKGPDHESTWYQYNTEGQPTVIRLPKSNNQAGTDYETRFEYAANGIDLTKVKRNLSGVEKVLLDIGYYANRDLHTVTDALGRTLTYTWHTNGLPNTITDSATSDVVTFEYDTNWRPSTIKINGQAVTTTTFDIEGRLSALFDLGTSYLTTFTYDNLNRLVRETHPDQSFIEQIWQCCYVSEVRSGKTVSGSDRILERAITGHDGRGLPTSITDTSGRVTQFGYDSSGRLTSLTDPKGNVTTWIFDDYGRIDRKVYPDSSEEDTDWKNAVQLERFKDRRGNYTYPIFYDDHSNITTFVMSGISQTRTYDTWDRLDTITHTADGSQKVHDFDYDLLGRVTQLNGPWSDDTLSWQYLDAQRKVIRTAPGNVATEVVSDQNGRLASILNPLGSFTHTYAGESDQLTDITQTGGDANGTPYSGFDTALTYHGDALRQALATLTSNRPGAAVIAKHTYGYDDLGRITSWKREAPTANPSGSTREFEWGNFYDFSSQLSSIIEDNLAGAVQAAWHYSYDPAGNLTSTQAHLDTSSAASLSNRTHNNLNQIASYGGGGPATIRGSLNEPGTVSVSLAGGAEKPARMLSGNRFESELPLQPGTNTIEVEAMDASGNRSSYTFDVAVASQGARSFSYDTAGCLQSDGVRSYEWDSLSRLKKITWATGKTTEFRYNGLGQRAERIDTDGATTTYYYYLYDGITPIDRRSGSSNPNTATADRRYHPQGEQRKEGATWTNYHYTRDHLGSVREVVKWDGTLVARYDYTPFGERRTEYEAPTYTGGSEIGYTDHMHLDSLVGGQTELVFAHFRAYDPELGLWLSPDPIAENGGANLYSYVLNNPVNLADPTGLIAYGGYNYNPYTANYYGSSNQNGKVDKVGVFLDALFDGEELLNRWYSFVDGVHPGTPMADMGAYDPCDKYNQWTRSGGQLYRDLLIMAGGLRVGRTVTSALSSPAATAGAGGAVSVDTIATGVLSAELWAAQGASQGFQTMVRAGGVGAAAIAAGQLSGSVVNAADFLSGPQTSSRHPGKDCP